MQPFKYKHHMKKIKIMGLIVLLSTSLFSCKKFSELQQNPSAIVNAAPKLVFTGLLLNMSYSPWSADHRNNQYMVLNESYYGNQAYGWTTSDYGNYTQLANVVRLETEAQRVGATAAPYLALAKFFRAYFFVSMTTMFGDIPMSQALQGPTDHNFAPKYDSQHDVYMQCLKLLDDANNDLTPLIAGKAVVEGDFYYNGDLSKWQKLINSFRLRVLISLSKRADDNADLNIRKQFTDIVSNPAKYPLILTNADNFQLVYNSSDVSNRYPLWPSDGIVLYQDLRNTLGATYVDIATKTQDPRLLVIALPTDSAKKSGDAAYATKFTSFKGGKTGDLQTTLKAQAVAGKLSNINFSYWEASPAGIPNILLGAAEVNLSIAEAVNRGWVPGDAAGYYNQGITESCKFYGVTDPAKINTFLTANAYSGNNTAGLTQILQQKYVAFFENSGREAYYNARRTDIPKFDIGPSNANNNLIPTRWAYPTSEYTVNTVNLKAAIQSQFNGADNQNGITWQIK